MKKKIEIEVPDGFQEKITNNGNNGVTIEFIPVIDKTIEMREFLIGVINGCQIEILPSYPDSIFYKKNDKYIFEYDSKNGDFWVNYDKVWKVFKTKFELNYDETQQFIKTVVEDTLKLKNITPTDDV